MTKVNPKDRTKPCHRKSTFYNMTKPRSRRLVDDISDIQFSINIVELEVKILSSELELIKLAESVNSHGVAEITRVEYDIHWSSGESDGEHEKLFDKFRDRVRNDLPDQSTINNHFDLKDFNVAVVNPGGLNQKRESITNAVHKHDIRAVVVSETHTAGKEIPKLDDSMKAFFHNRSNKTNKGGVAIFLEKTLAEHAVVVGKSSGDHEWIAVKVNLFDPPLVMIALYGCQTSKNTVSGMKMMWDELWAFINTYKENHTILLCGDFNAAVGKKFNLVNNCDSANQNGRLMASGVREHNLHVLNGLYSGDQRTHVDRSSDSSRCLDYIVTNMPKTCTRMYIDNDYEVTPYKVVKVKKGDNIGDRKYTDHKAIVATFKLKAKSGKACKRPAPITVKSEAGHVRYYEYTDALADIATELLNNGENILRVFKTIVRKLSECEALSYKRFAQNKLKRKMWSDREMFMKLTCDLEKQARLVENMKTSDKVFKMRGAKLLAERNQELFSMYDNQGNLVEDKESILDVLTKYNEDLLGRVPHPERYQEIYTMKKDLVELLDKTAIPEFNTITPRDYIRAIQKITNKGKAMFKQFLRMSPKMQAVFYFVFKRMYEEEIIPDSFIETTLIALYKKNDPRLASNYRFLHIRSDLSRLFQLLVYLKLENHFDVHTDESQMGGRKDCDTVEHLAMVTSMVKAKEEEGKGILATCVDAVKCFDRSTLSDNHAILMLEGADRKAMKMLYKYQHVNVIKVSGSDKPIIILNGMGQGGIPDARITTSGITEATVRHMKRMPRELVLMHRCEAVDNQGYVDDGLLNSDNTVSSGVATELYGDMMDELSLEAHPQKSVQIVMGAERWREQIKGELEANPNKLQGFPVKTSKAEKYLGMLLVEGNYAAMIDKNIEVKKGLMLAAATEIRNLCNLPQIRRVGKSYAQKLMAMSQIVPIALYASQAWIDIKDYQYKAMEEAFKASLLAIMSLPNYTNYEALLRVLGLVHMESFIDCVKLRMWNHKINTKKSGKMYRVILHEIVNKVKGGFAEDLSALSRKYNIPDITERFVCPDVITKACRESSYWRQWKVNLTLRNVPLSLTVEKQRAWYHELPYDLSRGMVLLDLGLLVFKTTQPHLMLQRNMASMSDRSCLWQQCDKLDSWSHLKEGCPFYVTKYIDSGNPVLDTAQFIKRLSAERIRNHAQSLVLYGDGEEHLADVLLDDYNAKHQNSRAREDMAELAVRFDNSEHLTRNGETIQTVREAVSCASLSQLSARALHRPDWAPPSSAPTHSTWNSCTAHTRGCVVTAMSSIIKSSSGGQASSRRDRDKHVSWSSFQANIVSAISTPGSKLRSSKEVIIMDPNTDIAKFAVVNGDVRIEVFNNDVSLGESNPGGQSHVKEVKKGQAGFEYTDVVTTQAQSMNNGRVKTITFEVSRTLERRANDETFNVDTAGLTASTGSNSSLGMNRGFSEERAEVRGDVRRTTSSPKDRHSPRNA